MKNSLVSSILLFISLSLQACSGNFVETRRTFIITESAKTIIIFKDGYIDKFITAEGFFPKKREGTILTYFEEFDKKSNKKLFSGVDFSSQYNSIESGHIVLDFTKNIAVVDIKPSEKYHWLDLNGQYLITFE